MKSPFLFLLALQGGLLLVGGGGMLWLGLPPAREAGGAGFWALVLLLALQGLEALFRRLFPASFREAEALHRDLALALKRSGARPPWLLALALAAALGEEVFFRGFLQSLLVARLGGLGLLAQALLFALLHPAPLRAYAYPLYTALAGLLFGLAYLYTGSLVPGVLAHFLHNAKSFYGLWRER